MKVLDGIIKPIRVTHTLFYTHKRLLYDTTITGSSGDHSLWDRDVLLGTVEQEETVVDTGSVLWERLGDCRSLPGGQHP